MKQNKIMDAIPVINIGVRISGEYRVVKNIDTEQEYDTGWMPNLVLDAGLNRLGGSSQTAITYCSVGTGSTAPAVSQTALVSHLASTSTTAGGDVFSNIGSPTYAGRVTRQFTYAQGAVVGNITELGVGWATGGGSLFSRTLIVDGAGTPTALPVVALDQLTVFYRVTITPVLTDLVSSVTISGITYNYTARLANATSFGGDLMQFLNNGGPTKVGQVSSVNTYGTGTTIGAVTGSPSGTPTSVGGTFTDAAYTNGNFYRDNTIVIAPAAGNSTGGIWGMRISHVLTSGEWQWVFTTAIPKDNTKTLTLIVRYTWGR